MLFDNFLSYNKINHETEGIISNEIEKKFLYDFKLNLDKQIIYVEIWGYSRGRTLMEKNYVKKKQKKENIYKKLNLKLIGINEKVFSKPFDLIYLEFETLIKKHVPSFSSIPINLDYFLWGSNYSKEDVIKELKPIVETNNGFFPSTTQLKKIEGGEGLISMIQKFGGVDVFKNILKVDIRPNEVKWSLDFLKKELFKFNKLEYLPSTNDLEDNKRLDILGGITRNGGFKKVSKLLSLKTKMEYLKSKPYQYSGKWNKENIKKEIKLIIKEIKRFPSEKDLTKLGRRDLYSGIKKVGGGMKEMKKEFGYHVTERIQVNEGDTFGQLIVKSIYRKNLTTRVLSKCKCGRNYETVLGWFKDKFEKEKENMTCGKCGPKRTRTRVKVKKS